MIEKPRPDLLTLLTTFLDFSVSRNLFLKDEIANLAHIILSWTDGLTNEIANDFVNDKFSCEWTAEKLRGGLSRGLSGVNEQLRSELEISQNFRDRIDPPNTRLQKPRRKNQLNLLTLISIWYPYLPKRFMTPERRHNVKS